MLQQIIIELSQFGFILSIAYILVVIVNVGIKAYARFKLGNDAKFTMSGKEKSLLLIAITYILTFLI